MTRKPPAPPSLADQARELQRLAPVGSIRRKAAGLAAVALENTRTSAAARRVLQRHTLPPEIRLAALALIDELTADPEGDQSA